MDIDLSQQELEILLSWYMNMPPRARLEGSSPLMRRLRAAFDNEVRLAARQEVATVPDAFLRGYAAWNVLTLQDINRQSTVKSAQTPKPIPELPKTPKARRMNLKRRKGTDTL